jgi:hypothetical protein
MGLTVAQLDAIANEQLDLYARGRAKLDLIDAHDESVTDRFYWHAYNGCARVLERFRQSVKELGLERRSAAARPRLDEILANHRPGDRE